MSPKHPSNYPEDQDKEFPISVEDGFVVELWFTAFNLEFHESCDYDWVMVVDGDGSVLLDKSCGKNIPARITSRTQSLTLQFHSDESENLPGFRAKYKQVINIPS